jgi:hypothetical protein
MKRLSILSAAAIFTVSFSGLAAAAANNVPGEARYNATAAHANPDAQCGTGAASGAFGYLGKDLNPGEETWDGGNSTDPGTTAQTGVNNSAVCGNRP